MSSSSDNARRRTDNPRRRTAQNVLLWLGVIVLAFLPFPWWW
jgi:hypothetical protein